MSLNANRLTKFTDAATNIGTNTADPVAARAIAEVWADSAIPADAPHATRKSIVDSFVVIAVTTRIIETIEAQQVEIRNPVITRMITNILPNQQPHLPGVMIASSLAPAIQRLNDLRSQAIATLDTHLSLTDIA